MGYLVNSHSNATIRRWHLWEIDSRFAPGLLPGWVEGQGFLHQGCNSELSPSLKPDAHKCFAKMCSGPEEVSHSRLRDLCITQL